MPVSRDEATKHRDAMGRELMRVLHAHGFPCKPDLVMGAYYVDLESRNGFFLEVCREHVKSARPVPDNYDYTGRVKIVFQGFGEGQATELIEPDDGFDMEAVVDQLGCAIQKSDRRKEDHFARQAEAISRVDDTIAQLRADHVDDEMCPLIGGTAVFLDGKWTPQYTLKYECLTELDLRKILAFAATLGSNTEATPCQA